MQLEDKQQRELQVARIIRTSQKYKWRTKDFAVRRQAKASNRTYQKWKLRAKNYGIRRRVTARNRMSPKWLWIRKKYYIRRTMPSQFPMPTNSRTKPSINLQRYRKRCNVLITSHWDHSTLYCSFIYVDISLKHFFPSFFMFRSNILIMLLNTLWIQGKKRSTLSTN